MERLTTLIDVAGLAARLRDPDLAVLDCRFDLARPAWGDFAVEIIMEYQGDPPWLDLDNLAKAILDSIKGHAFHDDSQVARLLVERRPGERERITVRATRLA